MSKFRLTGFARFFFVLLLVAPLAFIGSHLYLNGGKWQWQSFQDSFRPKPPAHAPAADPSLPAPSGDSLDLLRQRVRFLEQENADLKDRLDERDRLRQERDSLKKLLRVAPAR